MLVIPAIDIKEGRCVRLEQGQMSRETVYSDSPTDMAVLWYQKGAERLHLVDLDGAIHGSPVNVDVIRRIKESLPIPLQLGGGIRSMEDMEAYFNLGIDQVILGTVAYKDPEFMAYACERFPGKIILAIDAQQGRVSIEGWTKQTDISPLNMAKKFENMGIWAVIYTDILRDGMGTGPNVEATKTLAEAVRIPIIASGGISDLNDVARLLPLSKCGVIGMITGRALYKGTLDLTDGIKLAKQEK